MALTNVGEEEAALQGTRHLFAPLVWRSWVTGGADHHDRRRASTVDERWEWVNVDVRPDAAEEPARRLA